MKLGTFHMDVKETDMPPPRDAFTITARRFQSAQAAASPPPPPSLLKTAPLRRTPVPRWLIWLPLLGAALLLPNSAIVLLHLGATLMLVALLDPLVTFLVRRDVPRLPAVLAACLAAGAVLATVLALLWPYLIREIAVLTRALQASEPENVANKLGVLLLKAFPWLRTKSILQQLQAEFAPLVTVFVQTALTFETALLSNFASYGVVAFCVFYLLQWRARVPGVILRAVPNRRLEAAAHFVGRTLPRLGRFLRMQALLCFSASLVLAAAFHLMHLPGIVSMSAYGALALATPYWGALVGAIPLAVAAMNSTNSVNIVFGIVIALALMQLLNKLVFFSSERRKHERLSPLEGLLALLLGASLAGVWGILLGGPVMGLGKIVLQEWLAVKKQFRE